MTNQQNGCVPSNDSDQPGHPPSLIRVFAVHMKKPWVITTYRAHSEDSDQTGQMPRLIGVFAGSAQSDQSLRWAYMPFCWFCHEAALHSLFLNVSVL